ncbi:MAG: lysophospholipid acyltransferase family protein [SAR324 cluster bacterium]|uniref:Lysophospholipid acyltransferase family protein n=1 Tax=SAR324 cluster bacterium TaxID=2024889 RepID=A0A7X9FU06_9DELT|nr:lysophospholipid acyltransferase family protein [SAR324 cluster bacterium]
MTKTLTPTQKLSLAVLQSTLKVVGLIPIQLRSAFGFACGALFSCIPTRDRKVASLQLRLFLREKYNWKILTLVYAHLGQNIMESIELRPLLKAHCQFVKSDGLEKGFAHIANGKGIIALTAHTGNWDLLAAYSIQIGYRLFTVGREARNPVLQEILSGLRLKYKIETIWRANASAQRQIIRALKERAVVAGLIDQDTRVSGRMLPFFDVPAFTPIGLAEIAKRYDATVFTAFIVRKGFMQFEVIAEPIDSHLSPEEITSEYNRRLEAIIRENPSQWVWFHKRWRTLPDGKRLSSKNYITYLESRLVDVT